MGACAVMVVTMTHRSLPQPRTLDPMDAPSLRWGIIAPGGIARTFAQALTARTSQGIVAVGSRNVQRAQEFVDEFASGATAYGSYGELVADDDVDVVYVASPHSEHRDHALLAIEAGKHVLVEKAFTRNAAEAREVLEAAERAGVFVMEAMWSRFLPHYDVIRQAIDAGLIGDVRWIAADHGQALYPEGPQRLSDPALAGGALLDLGIYPLSFAAMLMPQVDDVVATGILTPQGVDECETITLRGGGSIAGLGTTMATQTPNTAVVAGTEGRLELDGWFYFPTQVRLVSNDGEVLDTFDGADDLHALHFEAVEVARCISDGRRESPLMPHAETLRVMGLMDEIRRQLGVVYPGE